MFIDTCDIRGNKISINVGHIDYVVGSRGQSVIYMVGGRVVESEDSRESVMAKIKEAHKLG